MDLGSLFGLLGTWLLIMWALISGSSGNLGYYVDTPSIILVCGASSAVIFLVFPMAQAKVLIKVLKKAFFYKARALDKLIEQLVSFAEIARRDGILSLENAVKDVDDPFIVRGIQMAVDGTDPELIEQIMNTELENLEERHGAGKSIFDAIGKYAPAFGMIGTLMGLVVMLKNMSDPSSIGAGMAVALLTTLYGAMIANGFALPVADRLALRSGEEILYKTIIIQGVMSIQSGDNPRVVEQKLRTYLPPGLRSAGEEKEAA